MMTRRHALKTTALAAVAVATTRAAFGQGQPATPGVPASQPLITTASNPFTLPPLPYALDALEPHIDAQTMQIHHDKHHAAYVANLNKAVSDHPDLGKKTIEQLLEDLNSLPENIRTAVRNNGGGHYNHSLFWQMMKKTGGGEPTGELAQAIDKSFGSFTAFKDKFRDETMKLFGSGWMWLVLERSDLSIIPTFNQGTFNGCCPRRSAADSAAALPKELEKRFGVRGPTGIAPLLGLDVWEHAYYLKYQNKRADYISAWWNVVNWDFVADRFSKSK